MSTIVSNTSVFTNREFPFKKITLSDSLEKRNRKYYVDYTIDEQPIFFQINKVVLSSEPIFVDDEQGYVDIEVKERLAEISKFFQELDNFNQISCFKNCEEWLGKNITIGELEGVYKTSYKNNLLRLKIERDNITIFDFKKNKLSLDKDIKVGNVFDIIVEISGLKVMKNSFATHLILRQIRKHPEPVPLKPKAIPNEYLFLDDYSNRNDTKGHEERSLDSQTDVDVLVNARKSRAPKASITPNVSKVEVSTAVTAKAAKTEDEELDISLSELKDPEDNHLCKSEVSSIQRKTFKKTMEKAKIEEAFDIEKDDENTKDYLQSVEKLKNIMSGIMDEPSSPSRKDKILNDLEGGELTLGSLISMTSEQSDKTPKKPVSRKKGTPRGGKAVKGANQELYKNL
jgi:hypothetical protein